MLTEQTITHCERMGKDKYGLTRCHNCPQSIRVACTSPCAAGSEGLQQWRDRVNQAVANHYGRNA